MKNIVKLIFLIAYLIVVFYIKNILIIIVLFFLNTIIIYFKEKQISNILKKLTLLLPFIIFTFIINSIIENFLYGFYIGIRLLMAYTISYMLIKFITLKELICIIEKLFSPLKIFNIDNKQIAVIISIAISIIPNLLNELEQKIYSLKSKSLNIKYNNLMLVIKSVLISIIIKTNEFENALISKGYSDDKN